MGHYYVKEDETFNTTRNGTVPKPSQQDITDGKVLKADGTWGEGGGGGASSMGDLTDVDLTGIGDGDTLVYDEQEEKFVPGSSGNVDDVEVNGTSVVDENKVAKIVSYKEVTRAEYDALPDTKFTDGVMYCIKDGFSNPNGFPPLIYSTEEREVGVWIDGKPLYEKVVTKTCSFTASTEANSIYGGNVDLSSEIPNIDMAWIDFNMSWYNPASSQTRGFYTGWYEKDSGTFYIRTLYSRSNVPCTFVIRYTKTTDTAGSGKWATDGGLAKHYSIKEQIIGTWIDGKPLYEKTVSFTAGSTAYDHQQILNILDADNYFVEKAYVINSSGYSTSMQGYTASQGSDEFCGTVGNITGVGLRLEYRVGSNNYGASGIIVVRYTKTTD